MARYAVYLHKYEYNFTYIIHTKICMCKYDILTVIEEFLTIKHTSYSLPTQYFLENNE